ncbi:carboxymuconolactone decarboxylase-like protein, Pxp2 [Schizosaccharomyces osmophilus]|uniref:Carboxymuconolactone decarboxylase-like protein, Pxp2 n=1 Tax=Schizosaccharomyces osmophilus TaxID=2545709 RepID=A0AAE9W900_9SCHI|nr:carboxymuconolactone decarboxylase-like protein, Pxp2 [Schizosaccharomyces osmophilus]WBW71879.1 carboxymuconolactone decarboxylase-like protein, Pxp2 [Schizosaccharomyces osmophilus]
MTTSILQRFGGLLEPTNFYIVSVVAYSSSNRPENIGGITKEAVEQVGPSIFAKLREALVKSAPLVGFPRTINSLRELALNFPKTFPNEFSRASDEQVNTSVRGKLYFEKTYGKVTDRVLNSMQSSSSDLAHIAIDYAYGKVLSFNEVISPLETSLMIIASLVPQDVNPQLRGHLKGALNHGATKEQVMAARNISVAIAKDSGIVFRGEVESL